MLVLSYQWNPVSMILGSFSPLIAFTAASTALVADADRVLGDGAGFLAAPDGVQLLLAGVVADDHDLAQSSSFAPLSTPMMEPSLPPKKPLMLGLAWIMALAMSVDFSWSPPPYCGADDLDVRVLLLHLVRKPSRGRCRCGWSGRG